MGVRLILTICSFFFLLLLLSALFGRRTKVNLGSRLYFMMISVVIALIVSDVLSFVIAVYTDYNLLSVIMLKIHWINEIFAYFTHKTGVIKKTVSEDFTDYFSRIL